MAVEGYCFIAGMSAVLVCLPVMGICGYWHEMWLKGKEKRL